MTQRIKIITIKFTQTIIRLATKELRRSDNLYDAFGILDYNWPNAEPGKGSAIFIHAWRRPRYPTEGCIAFDIHDLLWIFSNWKNNSRIIIK